MADQEKETGLPLFIRDQKTMKRSFGWVFFYSVDSSRSDEIIAGNGPLIVDRGTGSLHACGTAYSPECYIDAYEETGSIDVVDGL